MFQALSRHTGLLLVTLATASPCYGGELEDLYFGEALFHAYQGQFFEALERLDTEVRQHTALDEPRLDTLYPHIEDAEFSLGDFELRYRMHHRAGRAITAVLEAAVDERIRNDAAYRLARIHFQKSQMAAAQRALDRIEGEVPAPIRDDIEFLRASVYLAQDRPADAVGILKRLQDSKSHGGFAAYNLGIAYLQDGHRQASLNQLDRAGQIDAKDPAELAIADKANLVLGTMLLESGNAQEAVEHLNKVRLDGPLSNQALLHAGWANLSTGALERAVVPWSLLAERDVTDPATQEAMIALPYVYGQLALHGRAAVNYGRALDSFGAELEKLHASIRSIRQGKFLEALVREEMRQDSNWVVRLRSLPEAPETYYLMELMASHDFQTGLQNYLDLADLRKKVAGWQKSFDSFDEMVDVRHDHYEPLLQGVDREFRELDSRMRLRMEQHKMLIRRRDDLLTTPRPEFLATPEEHQILRRLDEIQVRLQDEGSVTAEALQQRVTRLKGLLWWRLQTEYHQRLTAFDRNVRDLEGVMAKAHRQYQRFVNARQAATHSYSGFEAPINKMRVQSRDAVAKIDVLMRRQGRMLEMLAINQLEARRDRLKEYGDQARFALADSYDRATQARAHGTEP